MDHQHLLVLLLALLVLVPPFRAPQRRERDASTLLLLRVWEEGCLLVFSLHSTRSFRSSFFSTSLIRARGSFERPLPSFRRR